MRYNPAVIEPKWQSYWAANHTFAAPTLPSEKKLYALDMFPYPSSNGLHVGHPEGYTATDIVCRFQRMCGVSVLHPMGWDAFGLPAEQHAKKTGIHPRTTTEQNIANFRRQLQMLGFSYDWNREVATTDVDYFRWTQFIFLLLYDTYFDVETQKGRPISELPVPADVAEHGPDAVRSYLDDHRLAYQIEAPVNWCPSLGTVLANEEVVGGVSERGGYPVVRMPLRQWMLRITAFATRLDNELDSLNWSESIKLLQRNWIGRSVGAEVDFFIGQPYTDEEVALAQLKTPEEWKEIRKRFGVGVPASQAFDVWLSRRKEHGLPRKPNSEVLRVYTTRPDTLYGATYMVLAPEHPQVSRLTLPVFADSVKEYKEAAARKSDLDRTDLAKDKTGVFTGSFAINPVTRRPVPIWVADYVLASYGTGAIMAVPAHDSRDFEFATQFGLPITTVVEPVSHTRPITSLDLRAANSVRGPSHGVRGSHTEIQQTAFTENGVAVNSGQYNGLPTAEFKTMITADLTEAGLGREAVNYKMRDWLFSRQHFWGEPFPLLRELNDDGQPTGVVVPLSPTELPLDLPKGMAFDAKHNSPEPPLENAPAEWLYVERNGKKYKRETNTMPQWAGSCWYYLRFIDPKNSQTIVDTALEKAWMPVDLYVGGAEHAVLHLLYSRFWHKVLYDRGYVSTPEPFQKLVNQGMILGEMEFTAFRPVADGDETSETSKQPVEKTWISAERVHYDAKSGTATRKSDGGPVLTESVESKDVVKKGDHFVLVADPTIQVDSRAYKMSKSRGNVVNPDDVVQQYGADSLRLYEMFMGPLESVKPWSMDGVSGVRTFLDRVWRLFVVDDMARGERPETTGEGRENVVVQNEKPRLHPSISDVTATEEQNRVLHKTIRGVTADLRNMSFNTAIAKMMEFTNYFTKQETRPRSVMEPFVLLLSPFAPHLCEELWELLGYQTTLAYHPWPEFDAAAIEESTVELPVQIGGKVRSKIIVSVDDTVENIEKIAMADPKIAELLAGKSVVKKIIIPGKTVNFVIRGTP